MKRDIKGVKKERLKRSNSFLYNKTNVKKERLSSIRLVDKLNKRAFKKLELV